MSDKYNLDDIIYQYIEIGKLTGTSQIVNNTLNQIKEIQYFKQKLKQEKGDWYGYTEPEEQIDINKYIDEVKKMNKDETKIFTIHHPYYRTKIREVSENLGYKCKSSLDANVESNADSKLIKCLSCKKTIPDSKVNWVTDYGSCLEELWVVKQGVIIVILLCIQTMSILQKNLIKKGHTICMFQVKILLLYGLKM